MKFVLFLFIGIHCLSVSHSKSKSKCSKKQLETIQQKYVNCFDRRVEDFYFHTLHRTTYDPDSCRSNLNFINKSCFMDVRKVPIKQCKDKNITEAFDNYHNVFKEALELICNLDKEEFNDKVIRQKEYKDCFPLPFEEIHDCHINHPLVTFTGNYSDSFCRNGTEGLKCIKKVLTTADCNSLQINVSYKLYELIRNNTPCANSN